ncbi:trypsin-like serine peptidase [Kitasatospora sp. NPDC101155]|uniref:trypsin-like serine peptidase n=1 Tax=Kitasatospora sp. NPDC101155 TaxID=3364097 RepID=UPI0037F76C16
MEHSRRSKHRVPTTGRRLRRALASTAVAAALVAAVTGTALATESPGTGDPAAGAPGVVTELAPTDTDAAAAYWTPERMAEADDDWPTTPAPQGAAAAGTPDAAATPPPGTPQATRSAGLPMVGRLFSVTPGVPGRHACTASVVHRANGGNAILTAAHCVYGTAAFTDIVFAPQYDGGQLPFGTYAGTKVAVPAGWAKSHDPDLDFALVLVKGDVESRTGGLTLRASLPLPKSVTVTGYPTKGPNGGHPITCHNAPDHPLKYQLGFACDGYEIGTSGSPWVPDGTHDVIGTLGGYAKGGREVFYSYASLFDRDVLRLYAGL